MCFARIFFVFTAVVASLGFLGSPILADWDEGDSYKMHYPQLPDPEGWDVNFTTPVVLADDFQCTETGPITDIHFWFSSKDDAQFDILNIHTSIHADIPDPDGPGPEYSMPLNPPFWERDFGPAEFSIRPYEPSGIQGWYDPTIGEVLPGNHLGTWQANIIEIPDPFIQEEGMIYWLDLSVDAIDPNSGEMASLGWKTSMSEHFNDDAVWGELGPSPFWEELRDPFEPFDSLDLAFVITSVPEPGSIVLLITAGLGLLLFAWPRRK